MASTASCGTVVPFPQSPHTPLRSKNDKYEYYNNYNIRARTREIVETDTPQTELTQVAQAFNDTLGHVPSRFVINQLSQLLASGVEAGFLVAVLEYSTRAPRPSWAYAVTVIQRNVAKGISTQAAFLQSLMEHRTKSEARQHDGTGAAVKRVIEQMYSQREYAPAEVNGMSAEDIEEAKRL